MLAPLLRVQNVVAPLDGDFHAVVFTSLNAVRAIEDRPALERLLALPAYSVGGRTAEAALALGFDPVVSADGDADDLVRIIRTHFRPGASLLYLSGAERSRDLAGPLDALGIALETRVVYRALAAERFPPGVAEALAGGRIDCVLHFSRRTAATFVTCARAVGLSVAALAVTHGCLSAQVAEPLVAAGAGCVRTAARPTEAALIDVVVQGAS
ncbi:MAG: uroporphyrinogen-III synthase [Hyphomicrobiales bacterium]|nr:uroporphyrinogen-III synthase [Hyphomicrobiales bacterium]